MLRQLSGKLLRSAAVVGMFASSYAFAQATTKPFDPARPTTGKAAIPAEQNNRQPAGNAAQPGQAQPAGQPGQGQPGQGAPGTTVRVQRPNIDQNLQKSLDSEIAACLIMQNKNEIALAKLAQEKAQHDDVKKFAKMLEQDHSKMVTVLQKFTDGKTETRVSGGDQPRNATQPTAAGQQGAAAQPAVTGTHSLENVHRQMKQELAEQCLADAKKELSDKESNRFDECFVGLQIAGHMKMHSELTVIERHVSSELKSVITDGLKTTDSHLEEAKSLMAELAKSDKNEKKSEKSGK